MNDVHEQATDAVGDVTRLLHEAQQEAGAGAGDALQRLLPILYDRLRDLATGALRHERPGHTLQATALVNEAYLRLVDQRQVNWQNRAHFLAIASQVMRRVLVDHARKRLGPKRGGDRRRLTLSGLDAAAPERTIDLIALDEALRQLADEEPTEARIVEMRFFADMSVIEIAEVLGVTTRTVQRRWNFAQAWLYRRIGGDGASRGHSDRPAVDGDES